MGAANVGLPQLRGIGGKIADPQLHPRRGPRTHNWRASAIGPCITLVGFSGRSLSAIASATRPHTSQRPTSRPNVFMASSYHVLAFSPAATTSGASWSTAKERLQQGQRAHETARQRSSGRAYRTPSVCLTTAFARSLLQQGLKSERDANRPTIVALGICDVARMTTQEEIAADPPAVAPEAGTVA